MIRNLLNPYNGVHRFALRRWPFCVKARRCMCGQKGALTVEYVLGIAIATIMMIGVAALFQQMAADILMQFEQLILTVDG